MEGYNSNQVGGGGGSSSVDHNNHSSSSAPRGAFLYAAPVHHNTTTTNTSPPSSAFGRSSSTSGGASFGPPHFQSAPASGGSECFHPAVKIEGNGSHPQQQQQQQQQLLQRFQLYDPSMFRDDHHSQDDPDLAQRQQHRQFHRHNSEEISSTEAIKAKIIAHPQYSNLVEAYMDCQKVGAPPEVVARLGAARRDFEGRQRSSAASTFQDPSKDPELDQFMEAYYNMLVKYREELMKPLQEAMEFMRRIETQLNMLTASSTNPAAATTPILVFASAPSADDRCEGVGSSEEDHDNSTVETEGPGIDPRAEDRELKNHLLRKYSGYLSSLKQELSKKKKKGKLPKDARQKLLNWWEIHYKWPYPSETEKVALAESTGLDQKQINNWFINQRKRHWKPSEDMQFMVMDGFHPQSAALYMEGHYMGDGGYRMGP